MKLQNHHTDDVLATLGLQTRRSVVDYLLPALGILGVGLLAGAGLGLLLAPKAGADLRQQISEMIRRRRKTDEAPTDIDSSMADDEREAAQ